jgi:hypothetical protein
MPVWSFRLKIILRELFNSILFDCPMTVTTKIKNPALTAGVFNASLVISPQNNSRDLLSSDR